METQECAYKHNTHWGPHFLVSSSDWSDSCIVSLGVRRRWRQRRGNAAADGNTGTCRCTSQETAHYVGMVSTVGHHHLQSQHAAADAVVGAFLLLFSFAFLRNCPLSNWADMMHGDQYLW